MEKKAKKNETEEEKEFRRAYVNAFLSPEKDQHIPFVDESYFYKIYGKENYEKMKAERKQIVEEEERQKS